MRDLGVLGERKMAYQHKKIERAVFRAYDIRGIIGTQLDEDGFYTLGRAISCRLRELQRPKIFIARDGRLTSEALATALKQGLLDSGIDVFDLGCVSTPIMYYATHTSASDCGLIVTGSHNPGEYNGLKIVLAGKTLAQSDIDLLYDLVIQGNYHNGKGNYQTINLLNAYQQCIINQISLNRPLKVVVDCGNGVAGPIVVNVISALGCEVIPLYCELDGNFPNHHPDPSVETNLIDLRTTVQAYKADIGLAFDGDADRLGVVTNFGEIIWPDRLLMLYARHILKQNKAATIVYDVKCSYHLAEVIHKAGGIPRMCPTGHSIVKGVMKETQAILAGEMSGHLFFKDRWFGFDDALYSACRLLEILSQNSSAASDQFAEIPNSINTPEIKIPIADEEKFSFMQRFNKQAQFPGAHIITMDGLRVEFADGWGLLRASNTTPCLVARFEAKDTTSLAEIQSLFKAQLQNIDKNLAISF